MYAAHKDAWEKAGVLHGDVSPRNILIDVLASVAGPPQALLVDWDLCKYKEDLQPWPSPSRFGVTVSPTSPSTLHNAITISMSLLCIQSTWEFGSALSLKYPRKPQELADDLESFVYIPTYYSLRNHNHCRMIRRDLENKPPPDPKTRDPLDADTFVPSFGRDYDSISLACVMFAFFHAEQRHKNGLSSGGDMKFDWIHRARPPVQLNYPQDAVLNKVLQESFKLLQEQYEGVDYERKEQYLAVQMPVTQPASPAQELSEDDVEPLEEAYREEDPQPSVVTADSATAVEATSTRPLDNHDALLEVFEAVLRPKVSKKKKPKKSAKAVKRKVEDTDVTLLPRLRPRKRQRQQ